MTKRNLWWIISVVSAFLAGFALNKYGLPIAAILAFVTFTSAYLAQKQKN